MQNYPYCFLRPFWKLLPPLKHQASFTQRPQLTTIKEEDEFWAKTKKRIAEIERDQETPKGCNIIAQGNALGKRSIEEPSPEGA